MTEFTLAQLEAAADRVHRVIAPTPQYCWPQLSRRLGAEVWVKHENHTEVGAFKVRGGVLHLADLRAAKPGLAGVVAATRGNHGQSVAFAATRNGLASTIVVPHGNSVEKNAAMRALGAELVEHGQDFQESLEHAFALAEERGLHFVASFAADLVRGVASYALELFRAVPDIARVYVPIGLGSGICAVIAARDALGLKTEVVGVCAENANAYALSFAAGRAVSTNSADTLADGMACRVPNNDALAIILARAARVVAVSEAEIKAAMRIYFSDTHNVAEGAGAAALAAALKEKEANAGRRVALVLSGGNVDRRQFAAILAEEP
ncbi:MAG: threonine dehydratase [Alphaproteobacteria bacterium]|nr:threonine dehydratase [Alphaproteobacteria bacterium]